MISRRGILAALTIVIAAGCASPTDPDASRTADTRQHSNTAESAPAPADTVGWGGNVMGGGH